MTSAPQLIIVETLFTSTRSKRTSYVLVLPEAVVEAEPTPEEEAKAFTLGIGRPQTPAEAAAIFVLSQHDDDEPAVHSISQGLLLEAEEIMQRTPDAENPAHRMWLVAEM